MSKKLNLIVGTFFTLALFLAFHALLAVTTLCWFVFLIPGMLFRWSSPDQKPVPIRGTGFGRH
jgi:hypothetical protein